MQVEPTKLNQFIEQIETLETQKAQVADFIKDAYAAAKAVGFDTKTLRSVIKLRKLSKDERDEQQHLLDIYMSALEGKDDL